MGNETGFSPGEKAKIKVVEADCAACRAKEQGRTE